MSTSERTARGAAGPPVRSRVREGTSVNDVLLLLTEALGADTAALLTAVDGGPVGEPAALSVEALLVRSSNGDHDAVAAIRGWNRGRFTLNCADRSLLGRALAGGHAVFEEASARKGMARGRPEVRFALASPIRPAGVCLGLLYATVRAPPGEGDPLRLVSIADAFAHDAARRLIRRPRAARRRGP